MPGGDPCDASCQKIIIDTGMGIVAAVNAYYEVVHAYWERATAGFKPRHFAAALFYGGVVELTAEIAQTLNRKHLSADQQARLMTQIDKACYRADKLLNWSMREPDEIADQLEDWTTDLLAWAKDDQNFYTALNDEVG